MNDLGVKTKTERGGRVFPASDSAHEVADAFKKYALYKNVTWLKNKVTKINTQEGNVVSVSLGERKIKCDSVIIATGGKSYPLTGSDGSGYRLAKALGHSIVEPKPSLIPIITKEKWVSDISGLSLKNVEISAYNKKNKKNKKRNNKQRNKNNDNR